MVAGLDWSEATRGSGEQKVTHDLKKQSDGGAAGVKDHHCAGGTCLERSDRRPRRAKGHVCVPAKGFLDCICGYI